MTGTKVLNNTSCAVSDRSALFFGRKEFPYQPFHCARIGAEGKIIPSLFLLEKKNKNKVIFSVISVSLIVFSWIEM